MNNELQLEKMFEVWEDSWHYEIGPDRDGLGMLEIRYYEGKETTSHHRLAFSKEAGALISQALQELV